jgi:lysophospholipase L1-like esterase
MGVDRRRIPVRAAWISLAVLIGGVLLLLQACLSTEAPAPPPLPEPQHLSAVATLYPFFAQLAALDGKTARQPVRVLQIGDSHTANDSLSGRLRDRLQARFGAAGRGWLPAGVPYKYYRPHLVSVSESGWQHVRPNDHAPVPLGLDANDAVSQPPTASIAIDSTEPEGFNHFGVEYLAQPDGSSFAVVVDGVAPVQVSAVDASALIKRFDLPLDHTARRVELRVEGKTPVVLLGTSIERRASGVIYENHGTIGATVGLLDQMTPQAVSFELANRQPALLIVAFGTNEGFDDTLDTARYAARFHTNIDSLRRASGAPVLILGPPDGNRVERGCTSTPCQDGGDSCAWHAPAKLAAVRDIQRRVAAKQGWAYWDWFGAMGGACSIDRMTTADPPLAMHDHVHLSTPGYQGIADMLFDDLMRGYEKWKAQQPSG